MNRRLLASLMAACLVSIGVAACSSGSGGGGRITVTADFSDVNSLEHHATVEMNGINVGVVTHIGVDGSLAKLTMSIKKSAHVPAGVRPQIRQPSLLGNEVVELLIPTGSTAGSLADGAVLATAAQPGEFQPDLESLVQGGTDLLGTNGLGAEGAVGTTALAQIIAEGAQGFGPEGGNLHAILDDLDTVVSGYATQTSTINALLGNLNSFASALGPNSQANAQALTNLANTTAVLDRQKDRLITLLGSLNAVSAQGASLLKTDLGLITDQLGSLRSVTQALANQQVSLGRIVQYLNGHNLSTSRAVDHNDDFLQVLNDFIVCGLPGGGEVANSPLDSCTDVPSPAASAP